MQPASNWPTTEQQSRVNKAVSIPMIPQAMGRSKYLKLEDTPFIIPCKMISVEPMIQQWTSSEAYMRLIDFLQSLNEAVRNKTLLEDCATNETVDGILKMFDRMDLMISEYPPDLTAQSRFGNISFRAWISRLQEVSLL